MNLKQILAVFYNLTLILCYNYDDDISATGKALATACEEFFIRKLIKFDLIIFGSSNHRMDDIVDEFLKHINESYSYKLMHVKDIHYWSYTFQNSAFVFVKNEQDLDWFNQYSFINNLYPNVLKFLIYIDQYPRHLPTPVIHENTVVEISALEYFLINNSSTIIQFYYDKFSGSDCKSYTRNKANVFDKESLQWHHKLEFPEHFHNFYGCTIVLEEGFGPFLYFKERNNEIINCISNSDISPDDCNNLMISIADQQEVQGFYVELFKIISEIGNFTTQFKMGIYDVNAYSQMTRTDFMYPLIKLFAGSMEVAASSSPLSLMLETHFLFALTPSEFYTAFEKLLLPFDPLVWILLFFTFIIAFLVIFTAYFLPKTMRFSLFGSNNSSPALNVVHIFFGISQMKLPRGLFNRYILILFILFCLIFRTCYQSMLFEFMTTDMRKPPPKTFDELLGRNYTIIVCEGHEKELELIHPDIRYRKSVLKDCSILVQTYCNLIDITGANTAFFMEDIQYDLFNNLCQKPSLMLKHFHRPSMGLLFLIKNSFLHAVSNEMMEKTIPFGIPQYLYDFHLEMFTKQYVQLVGNKKRVLSLNDLSYGFILWICACVISVMGFVLEATYFWCYNCCKGF